MEFFFSWNEWTQNTCFYFIFIFSLLNYINLYKTTSLMGFWSLFVAQNNAATLQTLVVLILTNKATNNNWAFWFHKIVRFHFGDKQQNLIRLPVTKPIRQRFKALSIIDLAKFRHFHLGHRFHLVLEWIWNREEEKCAPHQWRHSQKMSLPFVCVLKDRIPVQKKKIYICKYITITKTT